MRPNRHLLALVTLFVVAAVTAGVFTGAFSAALRSGLYATGLYVDGGSPTVPSDLFETPVAKKTSESPTPQGVPRDVLPPASNRAQPKADRVAAKVASVKATMGGRYGGSVLDVGSGSVLYDRSGDEPLIPASTVKLLTSAAALDVFGPEHRFTTSVVSSPARKRIILVGGGDPYLSARSDMSAYPARASLKDLAGQTAARLKESGTTRVELGYDESLFSGPHWNPKWPLDYADQVTSVSALWVAEGRVNGGSPGPRVADPARTAAKAFASALKADGIVVTSVAVDTADPQAGRLASVESMPLQRIVEQLLLTSDNDAAEVLFRHVGLGTGKAGSFTQGARAVQATLNGLGVAADEMTLYDGSGLARQTKVSPTALAEVLRLGADSDEPEFRALITGLPVAGVEGSLRLRFFDDRSLPGRGLVRAKTGTLRQVHSLAGYVRTEDGSTLVYAFIVNGATDDYGARIWLDRVTTALSGCGCR